ncbi:hypothetical protein MUK42_36772 [Musa troglodytarum]|uniref:Uncharacterized protein n=1 Tax=Musa troglodytarum TaxID=320322 RepID=A0A9E7K7W6_9LILI|nr:hypothetical protein MUK42_36772 [Musa troglodytarum]
MTDGRNKRKMLDVQWGAEVAGSCSERPTMDSFLRRHELESLRNTMLKHEEVFRHQVHELHQLYRVQRMLMAELRSEGLELRCLADATLSTTTDAATARLWSSSSTVTNVHQRKVSSTELNFCFDLEQPGEAVAAEERSTACGKHREEERRSGGLRKWMDDESGVELTLSIGRGSGKNP